PTWINQTLKTKLSEEAIKKAVCRLIDLGLLSRDQERRLYQSQPKVSTDSNVFSLAVLNFHYQMLRRAGEALEKSPRKVREISTLTLALTFKEFESIKAKLEKTRREIHALVKEKEPKEAVYQLNLQFFNLSEVPW
ncbi:MAG: DUF4423 domain-containing protein, partial [Deltaproteobacteria bacterium]|nr:DUF4423 domain-containing protein [Deltaproteobacteria bacterium]